MSSPSQQTKTEVHPQEVPPQMAMLKMISGFWISRSIYVAAKLGIPDLLQEGAKTAEELAQATGTHARSLYRVLRALASVGVFSEEDGGRFALTPLSTVLQTNTPGSIRWFTISELGEEHYPAWGDLMHSVKTGGIAFDHVFGMDVWEFFQKNPDNARLFNDSMSGMTAAANEAIMSQYDFSSFKKIVDIGGGHGGLIISILKANPELRGVLFDSPSVAEGARQRLESAWLTNRCESVAGDFFKSVPTGADGYILKWIIHDWDDERATAILRNIRDAITGDGKLLVVDVVIPPGSEPHFGKFIDLNMLVMTGGHERTEQEFRQLFATSGFNLNRVVRTESPFSIVEGMPA
jgi:hypothetical protein